MTPSGADPARPITYEELVELARRYEGVPLRTVTGKQFTVGVALDCPFFTPASSGWGQSDGRKAAERFVARYNETGSLRPRDYADVTRNASYFIGLLIAAGGATERSRGRVAAKARSVSRSHP